MKLWQLFVRLSLAWLIQFVSFLKFIYVPQSLFIRSTTRKHLVLYVIGSLANICFLCRGLILSIFFFLLFLNKYKNIYWVIQKVFSMIYCRFKHIFDWFWRGNFFCPSSRNSVEDFPQACSKITVGMQKW